MAVKLKRKRAVNNKNKKQSPLKLGQVGSRPIGPLGIILITVYLILFSILLLYGLIQFWPPAPPPLTTIGGTASTSTSVSVTFLYKEFPISEEIRLLLIVALAGALGAMVHTLRSFYWYVGNRLLVRSWLAMYILMPFVGTTLGLVFYLLIRGGFFTTQTPVEQASPFGFAALAALVGLFAEQAVLKLKQVAETLLAKAPKGREAKPQE